MVRGLSPAVNKLDMGCLQYLYTSQKPRVSIVLVGEYVMEQYKFQYVVAFPLLQLTCAVYVAPGPVRLSATKEVASLVAKVSQWYKYVGGVVRLCEREGPPVVLFVVSWLRVTVGRRPLVK